MSRPMNFLLMAASGLIVSTSLVHIATPQSTTVSFLEHAAEGQWMEMALGQMATQKATDEQVKQFGARMIQDHKKAGLQIRTLVLNERIELHAHPLEQHKHLITNLSQLSGKEFDRAYMTSMLRAHAQYVKDFGQHSLMEENMEVRQWAASALPVLKEHLAHAKTIASSIGIEAAAPHNTPHQ